jgi:hypothetical protein
MSKRRIIIRIPSGGAPPTPASITGVGGSGGSSALPKRARVGESGAGTTPALIQATIAVAGMEYWGGKGMGGASVGGGGSPLPLATSIAEETGEGRAGGHSGGTRSTATSGSTSIAEVDPEVVGGEITLRFTNNTNTNRSSGSDTEDEEEQEAEANGGGGGNEAVRQHGGGSKELVAGSVQQNSEDGNCYKYDSNGDEMTEVSRHPEEVHDEATNQQSNNITIQQLRHLPGRYNNDVYSEDNSLLSLSSRSDGGNSFDSIQDNHAAFPTPFLPIITSFQKPRTKTMTTPAYRYQEFSAPKDRDAIVTYENMGDCFRLDSEPLCSTGISSIISFSKSKKGIMWQNRTSVKLHYETSFQDFELAIRHRATQKGVQHHTFIDGTTQRQSIIDGENVIILAIGDHDATIFKNFHQEICFQEVMRDTCIPADYTIAQMDNRRQNSGISVGLSSGQGTARNADQAHAEPQILCGTHRFSNIFRITSDTTRHLIQSHGLQGRFRHLFTTKKSSQKQKHYKKKCNEICPNNIYLSLSFKIYVHNAKNIRNHNAHFQSHRDEHNPHFKSPNDIMFTAWDTWFEPKLSTYVTGTIIACGRRSQEDLFDRTVIIDKACDEMLRRLKKLPRSQCCFIPTLISMPIRNGKDFVSKPVHILRINAFTPNDYIER